MCSQEPSGDNTKNKIVVSNLTTKNNINISDNNIVLCGKRGRGHSKNPGNMKFAYVIKKSIHTYVNTYGRNDKALVVASVVNCLINDHKLQFMSYDSKTNELNEIPMERIHDKVSHAIRDQIKQNAKFLAGGDSKQQRRRPKKCFSSSSSCCSTPTSTTSSTATTRYARSAVIADDDGIADPCFSSSMLSSTFDIPVVTGSKPDHHNHHHHDHHHNHPNISSMNNLLFDIGDSIQDTIIHPSSSSFLPTTSSTTMTDDYNNDNNIMTSFFPSSRLSSPSTVLSSSAPPTSTMDNSSFSSSSSLLPPQQHHHQQQQQQLQLQLQQTSLPPPTFFSSSSPLPIDSILEFDNFECKDMERLWSILESDIHG